MLMFGTCVGYPDKWRKYALPGVQFNMDEPYRYVAQASVGHVAKTYQDILECARAMPDVEALVLLHDDLQIQDPKLASKIRRAIAAGYDIVGLVGTTKLTSLYWWEHGPSTWRGYAVDGRNGRTVVCGADGTEDARVASVDGMLFAMSRWAIDNVNFDPDLYNGIHGYVEHACMQARAVGVTRIDAFHHSQGGYAGGEEAFRRADEVFRKRWCVA